MRMRAITAREITTIRQRSLRAYVPIFIAGAFFGLGCAFIFMRTRTPERPITYARLIELQRELLERQKGPHHVDDEPHHVSNVGLLLEPASLHKHEHKQGFSDDLSKTVRVACWILTSPNTHSSKAMHVKLTWGKRCDVMLFMSSALDSELGTIALPIASEDRLHLWQKTMLAFKYVYNHYVDKADWFLKADDDTYVIVENLRHFLSTQNTSEPIYFGHKFRSLVKSGYMSGGAGYVLSKEALRRFASGDPTKCALSSTGPEDANIGRCLEVLGVTAGYSRDERGAERFMPFDPLTHTSGSFPSWYKDYTAYPLNKGESHMSDSAISFHYVEPTMMHTLDFLLYHLRPYGTAGWYEMADDHMATSGSDATKEATTRNAPHLTT